MLKIEYLPIEKIKPDENNPRTINDRQFKVLCESIKNNPDFFEARPILVDKQMVIFAGNMRYRAALELGLKQVPVAIMDVSPEKRTELMMRDNIQNGQWNVDMLASFDPNMLKGFGFNLNELGVNIDKLPGFSLPDGEKGSLEQITFTLAKEQAEAIKAALEIVEPIDETFGNENKNGNAIYAIVKAWSQLKAQNK